jgi:hypothetical protein
VDTPDWVDKDGDGCDLYERYDEPGCPKFGDYGGNMGPADDNCCYCFGTCVDTPDWVDKEGDGCDWYEANENPGCPVFGDFGGDMGPADDNCCFCFGT